MIPYGRQEITKEDILEVEKVLRSDFLTQGPVVPKFEQAVLKYCGAKHAVAVNSATSALHIACLALNLGPNDYLWTSPNTFVASANCGIYCGANIDFVDIDSKTFNMSVEALSTKLIEAEKKGKLPKIVIPVHFAGQPGDMEKIYELSKQYGFRIIEDASHAIGASYNDIKIGSCKFSDITIFSFHPVKIITTGEGGMALTNDKNLANHMRRLSTHGITKEKELMHPRPNNEIWNYQQIELGFNYRLTDIQAALGLSQLNRLDEYVKIRHKIAEFYNSELNDLNIQLPFHSPKTYSSYHLYPIRIKNNLTPKTQKQIYDALWDNDIAANILYIPVHRQPYYENLGFKLGDFPQAEQFHREVICLPMFPKLTKEQQTKVVKSLKLILKGKV
jgi:UDP-4-amino-4,6-dideoxy-N-acetyl-beta-L-altrosamine transaminase